MKIQILKYLPYLITFLLIIIGTFDFYLNFVFRRYLESIPWYLNSFLYDFDTYGYTYNFGLFFSLIDTQFKVLFIIGQLFALFFYFTIIWLFKQCMRVIKVFIISCNK